MPQSRVKFSFKQIRRFSAKFISWVRGMKQSLSALNPSAVRKEIIMVLVLLFLAMFCAMTGRIFVQYTSKLLGWPISTTGYILSVRAFVSLVVLFGLAALTRFVDKWGKVKSITLDIWIVRLSFAALVVGTVFIAMSSGPGLLITGTSGRTHCYSLCTWLIWRARIYFDLPGQWACARTARHSDPFRRHILDIPNICQCRVG